VVAALGVALAAGGIAGVIRHRTTIVPHHPVANLVTSGAYRLSRNPMYAGLATVYVGGAFLAGTWWPLVFWPVVLALVTALVIRPEERYLAQRFGETYARYRAEVRRWL
jgi:protein-S-isoprenylcysteine O-methyltransferase Ste14